MTYIYLLLTLLIGALFGLIINKFEESRFVLCSRVSIVL